MLRQLKPRKHGTPLWQQAKGNNQLPDRPRVDEAVTRQAASSTHTLIFHPSIQIANSLSRHMNSSFLEFSQAGSSALKRRFCCTQSPERMAMTLAQGRGHFHPLFCRSA